MKMTNEELKQYDQAIEEMMRQLMTSQLEGLTSSKVKIWWEIFENLKTCHRWLEQLEKGVKCSQWETQLKEGLENAQADIDYFFA